MSLGSKNFLQLQEVLFPPKQRRNNDVIRVSPMKFRTVFELIKRSARLKVNNVFPIYYYNDLAWCLRRTANVN